MRKCLLLAIGFFLISKVFSQPAGSLDNMFNSTGKVITDIAGKGDQAQACAIQTDGKIVVAGLTSGDATTKTDIGIVRYNSNGTLDNTFGTNGKVVTDIRNTRDYVTAVTIQQNGKIVVSGYSEIPFFSSQYDFFAVRYNIDGSIDSTFNSTGIKTIHFGYSALSTCLLIQPDKKIVFGGYLVQDLTLTNNSYIVARYNSDGSFDDNFSGDGKIVFYNFSGKLNAMDIQQDEKIIIGGTGKGISLMRFQQNGERDSTFGINGIMNTRIDSTKYTGNFELEGLKVQLDGKIVVTGNYYRNTTVKWDIFVARFNSNGSTDTTFGTRGITITDVDNNSEDFPHSLAIQTDGKIVIGGDVYTNGRNYFNICRYTANGILDNSFSNDGKLLTEFNSTRNSFCNAIALQQDDKIVAVGDRNDDANSLATDFAVARYLSELTLSTKDFSKKDNAMLIYPNPVSASSILKYELKEEQDISIYLSDMQGKVIQTLVSQVNEMPGKHNLQLNISSDIPSGSYILIMESSKGSRASIKIMKQ